MPTTYNGIGTHYYGKKNVENRSGTCQFCGNRGTLSSYDTRLWFVVIFIPVIPLGKKRIIDYCSSCTRHFMMELHKWEAAKQLEVSGAMEKFRSNPTPEAAVEAHQQLLKFHQYGAAESFRQTMRQQFADNAKVHLHLALCHQHLGEMAEADQAFARVLELRPDMPEAKIGAAEGHIRAGRLDEARKLLEFLEHPGAEQLYPLGPLEELANAYQAAGNHHAALALFHRLLTAIPKVAEHDGFRKRVKKSEKALGKTDSILPKGKFNWRKFFTPQPSVPGSSPQVTWRGLAIAGVIAAVVLLLAIIGNEHTRRHRVLHVAASVPGEISLQIGERPAVTLRNGLHEIDIPEGKHRVRITGSVTEELDIELKSGFFDRWFSDVAWVLNPGGAAILVLERATYSKNPPPSEYSFHFGQSFHWFPDVTHAFKSLPDSLSMKSHETRTLTQVDFFRESPAGLFSHLISKNKPAEAMVLAESRLRVWPTDEEMLDNYVSYCLNTKQSERLEKFLAKGLDRRPVQISWHRRYQSLDSSVVRENKLAGDYDAMLAREPGNSALLYLRGRVASTRTETKSWFEKSLAADSKNPFPWYALAYDHASRGDWAGARNLFSTAISLAPGNREFNHAFFECRLALKEYEALETEWKKTAGGSQASLTDIIFLIDILVAQDKHGEVQAVMDGYTRKLQTANPEAGQKLNRALQEYFYYSKGDFAALEKAALEDKSEAGKVYLFQALTELGRLEEAAKLEPAESMDPFDILAVSLAWDQAGNADEAGRWRNRGLKLLKEGNSDQALAGKMIEGDAVPTMEAIDEVGLAASQKSVFLAVLGVRHPSMKADFFARARQLNVMRAFPHHLIARTLGK